VVDEAEGIRSGTCSLEAISWHLSMCLHPTERCSREIKKFVWAPVELFSTNIGQQTMKIQKVQAGRGKKTQKQCQGNS